MYYELNQHIEYPGRWRFGHLSLRSGTRVDSRMFCKGKKVERDQELVLSINRPDAPLFGGARMVITPELAKTLDPAETETFPVKVGWDQELVLPIKRPGQALMYSGDYGNMPVVTRQLGEALLQLAPEDVQLFPVQIPGQDQEYCILNVTQTIDCIDERRTRGEYWQPGMEGRAHKYLILADLHINPQRTQGHHLFRLKDWKVALICSQEIKDLFDSLHVTGALFVPVV